MTRISWYLGDLLPWVLIAILVFNMSQRRRSGQGNHKRLATLWIAGLVGGLWAATIAFKRFGVPDPFLLVALAILVVVGWMVRSSIFVFRLRCSHCRAWLPLARILYHDDTLCAACRSAQPEEPTR